MGKKTPSPDIQKRLAADLATNDFDGDGKAGGSLPALSWQLAEVAYAACWAWSEQRCGEITSWWSLNDNDRLLIAIEADRCINEPGYVPTYFPNDGWESNVRNTLFASVVRAIAL